VCVCVCVCVCVRAYVRVRMREKERKREESERKAIARSIDRPEIPMTCKQPAREGGFVLPQINGLGFCQDVWINSHEESQRSRERCLPGAEKESDLALHPPSSLPFPSLLFPVFISCL